MPIYNIQKTKLFQIIQNLQRHIRKHPVIYSRNYSKKLFDNSPTNLPLQAKRNLLREFRAISRLVDRSTLNQVRAFASSLPDGDKNQKNDDKNKKDSKKNEENNKVSSIIAKAFLWLLAAYLVIAVLSLLSPGTPPPDPIFRYVSWSEFVHHMLAKGEVAEVVVRPDVDVVSIILHDGAIYKGKRLTGDYRIFYMNIVDMDRFEEKLREAEERLGIKPEDMITIMYERYTDTMGKLMALVIIAGLLLAVVSRTRNIKSPINMDSFKQMGRAKFTLVNPVTGPGKGVHFSDVAGLKEAKQEVMEFVDYLKNPDRYRKLGAKVPKGALLLGPPGCGKTLLAKAVATEANVPFLAMNGSEFIEMIGGLGAARVRDLFQEGRKRAPCIIYIDEIDAIGRKRGGSASQSGFSSGESEQTLNQLLVEMDGIATKEGVIMLASTNRSEVLDKALLRPGRFDRHILIDLPNVNERQEIFERHLKSISLEHPASNYSKRLAQLTPGFSGADIANVCNEAALHAARQLQRKVVSSNLEYAVERVVGGTEKRSHAMSPHEKRVVAYHEAGHALVGWLLEHTDALLKITIVPRTNLSLGGVQYNPKEQKLFSKEELFERMCMALGGRVAESITFNSITSGAQNDLQKVTNMAYAQIRQFGMSDTVGLLSFPVKDSGETGRRPYSKLLSHTMDLEVQRLVALAYKRTEEILRENKEKLELLAETLLKQETLNYEDVEKLIGPPPFGQKKLIEPIDFDNSLTSLVPPDSTPNSDEHKPHEDPKPDPRPVHTDIVGGND